MTRLPDYLHRIRDAVESGVIPRGDLSTLEIEHGPGCRHSPRRSATPCTCHPRITVLVADDVLVIGTGGAVLERSKRQ